MVSLEGIWFAALTHTFQHVLQQSYTLDMIEATCERQNTEHTLEA